MCFLNLDKLVLATLSRNIRQNEEHEKVFTFLLVILRHCEAQISKETETQHLIVQNVQYVCTVLFKLSLSNVPRGPLLYKRSHALLSVSCRNELREQSIQSNQAHKILQQSQIVQI